MDKFPKIGERGITPDSLKMRVLSDKSAKPLLFGKSVYNLVKDIFCGKTIIKSFESTLSS